jgi:hypothetical protein
MSSIVLSFVGGQDPFSGPTDSEGSIVSLIKHLVAEKHTIKHVLLLHTKSTSQGATDTCFWLESSIGLPAATIERISLPETLSDDPVNLSLAVESVKDLLIKAKELQELGDRLELNASSGTPAMKSTWGILQAAGYIPHSQVWQVRNPKEMQPGQDRVFATDMGILRQQFDRTIIQQQLADYNYSGALITLESSSFKTDLLVAMVKYGHSRSAFDFDRAGEYIESYRNQVSTDLLKDIDELRKPDDKPRKPKDKLPKPEALLKEIYYGAEIYEKTKNYCNFLIAVGQFQENSLRLLLSNAGLPVPEDRKWKSFWLKVEQVNTGKLLEHLSNEQTHHEYKYIRTQGELNIPTMLEILRYFKDPNMSINTLEELEAACKQRNAYMHKLKGVSEVPEAQTVLNDMRTILCTLTTVPQQNPFDRLNAEILAKL